VNFSQFLAAAHILKVIFDETALDRPRQPAHAIFSINRVFKQFMCRPRRLKEACAARVKKRHLSKNWLFYRYWRV